VKEKISPYLRSHMGEEAFRLQYVRAEGETETGSDPLMEDAHEPVKGLVHKYPNRALIKVSYQCASHCRFCTRIRQIGKPDGTLTADAISAIQAYLTEHPEVEDVILSGGDPLYTPGITEKLLLAICGIPSIKVLRIGTRLPVHLPDAVRHATLAPLLRLISELAALRPFFILVHVNHPDELTPPALAALRRLRDTGAVVLSQTVFLRGINDCADVLSRLFRNLYHHGVMPYYIYHCDAVRGLERFVVPLETEQRIMTKIHATLSGIAVPRHVLDVEEGYGKLSVPQEFIGSSGQILQDYHDVGGGALSPVYPAAALSD
jgi:lysine 2,3-aminomutase